MTWHSTGQLEALKREVTRTLGVMEPLLEAGYPVIGLEPSCTVMLQDEITELLPEVMLGVDADRFAQIAAAAFTPRPVPSLRVDHLHVQAVSVPEQAMKLMGLLESRGVGEWASFTDLVADANPIAAARFSRLNELQ